MQTLNYNEKTLNQETEQSRIPANNSPLKSAPNSHSSSNQKSKASPFVIISFILLAIVAIGIATYFSLLSRSAKTPEQGLTSQQVQATSTPVIIPKKIKYQLDTNMLFLGDMMLARTIGDNIVAGQDPFANVKTEFKKYDTIIGNVETNISAPRVGNPVDGKMYTFNAPLEVISVMKSAGIDVAVMANNHTSDYGQAALVDMKTRIEAAGIKTVGAGANSAEAFKPALIELPLVPIYEDGTSLTDSEKAKLANTPSVKIAIIALNSIESWYTDASDTTAGSAFFDIDKLRAEISKAKNELSADLIVVIPHWGIEYQLTQDSSQVEWGHLFIDNGADLVVGGHPHVRQPSEEYKGKMIYYSLGNFMFDQMDQISQEAISGNILSVDITVSMGVDEKTPTIKLAKQKLIGIKLNAKGEPELVESL